MPRFRRGGRLIIPKRMRISRLTGSPSASKVRRTTRLRPSLSITRYQWLKPFAPLIFKFFKLYPTIFQFNALPECQIYLRFRHHPLYPDRIFALHFKTRMHQPIRQFSGSGENQQATGIKIQAANRDPFLPAQFG